MRLAALRVDRHRRCRERRSGIGACRASTGSFCFSELPWMLCPIKFSSINPAIRRTAGARRPMPSAPPRRRRISAHYRNSAVRCTPPPSAAPTIILPRPTRAATPCRRRRNKPRAANPAPARRRRRRTSISLPPLTGNANPCMQRWHTSCGTARITTLDPRAARVRLRKRESSPAACPRAPPANPATGANRRAHRLVRARASFPAQAGAIDEVWQVGCHRPRIIGLVTTPVKNESGASRCF